MATNYTGLLDEDKFELCIEFIALGIDLPGPLQDFLIQHDLLTPKEHHGQTTSISSPANQSGPTG